jgi:putative DNA primase/helicase
MEQRGTTTAGDRGSAINIDRRLNYNPCDIIAQFKSAMRDSDIMPPNEIIADGNLHRFHIEGDSAGTLNGAYTLHLDGRAAGYFEDFRKGIKQKWKQHSNFLPLSDFQKQAFKARYKHEAAERKALHDAKHAEAARNARIIWENAPPAPADHPYLIRKHIKPHDVRLGRDNVLIISMYNAQKELVSLQFINETGSKRFLCSGLKKGCFYWLGENTGKILICEGFATGASLYEESGYLTVIAFDAGNLKDVAIVIKSLYPNAEIIICGDNDESEVGQKSAKAAALAIGGKYIIPPIVGQDFNDFLSGGGVTWLI